MSTDYDRWRRTIGPVTLHVEPGKITRANGTVITTGLFGLPLGQFALAHALRICTAGDVIGLRGNHPGVRMGSVNAGSADEPWQVVRAGFQPVPRVAIVPDDDATEGPSISGQVTIAGESTVKGGVEDLTIGGIDLKNGLNEKCNVLVEHFIKTGSLRIKFCALGSLLPASWNGAGKMWGVRPNGVVKLLEIEQCQFTEANEHAIVYADNPMNAVIRGNTVEGRGGNRTCIQIVNRLVSGPAAAGRVVIEDNQLVCKFGNWSSGGGAITIAGYTGGVRVVGNHVELDGNHSGLTVWTPAGTHLTNDGYSTARLVVKRFSVVGGKRPHMAISGVREAYIEQSFRLKAGDDGAKTCIDLDDPALGGGIRNGAVQFTNAVEQMSAYTGFQSGAKVKRLGQILTAAQIDAMVMQ